MVCSDNQLIRILNDQMKQKAQDLQKVFNFAVPKRIEAVLVTNICGLHEISCMYHVCIMY